jgi:hypothetical protein
MLFQESVQGQIKFHRTEAEGIREGNMQVAA